MNMFRGDASEVYQLADEIGDVPAKMIPALRSGMASVGEAFAGQWARNATETAGEHGKHYPKSIDSELVFDVNGVSVDTGPNSRKRQGGMGPGFEFGSENQTPHLDGLRAMGEMEKRAERVIDSTIGYLFP